MLKIILIVLGVFVLLILLLLFFMFYRAIYSKRSLEKLSRSFNEGDSVEYMIDEALKLGFCDFMLIDDERNILLSVHEWSKENDLSTQTQGLKEQLLNLEDGEIIVTKWAFLFLRYNVAFRFRDKRIIQKRRGMSG